MAETNTRPFISYAAPKRLYGLCWGTKPNEFRLAASTFIPGEYVNKLQILHPSPNNSELISAFEIDHPYPPTKVMWSPQSFGNSVEYLATTADYLRLWTVTDTSLERHATITNVRILKRNQETCAPLTSFDWNVREPNILGTTSIDTTCTIWDLNNFSTPKHQIIAHDDEVYDISFSRNDPSLFVSVGGDGSLRSFDLRALDSSQIMYESLDLQPLLRVAWNPHDDRYLATMIAGKPNIVIIDSRSTARPIVELTQHTGSVNSISWSPHARFHICSAAEDHTAIAYDIANVVSVDGVATGMNARHANTLTRSVFFRSQTPINQVRWSPTQEGCIAVCDEDAVHVVQL